MKNYLNSHESLSLITTITTRDPTNSRATYVHVCDSKAEYRRKLEPCFRTMLNTGGLILSIFSRTIVLCSFDEENIGSVVVWNGRGTSLEPHNSQINKLSVISSIKSKTNIMYV